MRFEIIGMVDGEERIVVEHVTRLRDEDAPDWPQGGGYRILIEGEPHVKLELELSSDLGDHNHAGCLATAMHVVNAIPSRRRRPRRASSRCSTSPSTAPPPDPTPCFCVR